jgi:hypothetical protein
VELSNFSKLFLGLLQIESVGVGVGVGVEIVAVETGSLIFEVTFFKL